MKSLADSLEAAKPILGQEANFHDRAFVALNTAFFSDGIFVRVSKGVQSTVPIHLVFVSLAPGAPSVSHPRVVISVEEGARATVVEEYVGLGDHPYFTNTVTEAVVGRGATLDHYKIGRESEQAFHIGTLSVRQERDSKFVNHSLSLGGALVRNDLGVLLGAEGGDCTLNGLYVLHGRQHVDHQTTIDHAKPNCGSHELYKGLLDGTSRGVFDGKIIVREDAQKTNATQMNKNLLLSDKALVNSNPRLEIFADDVKCRHGSSIGQIDGDAMFYLRSRGIKEADARRLLISAFAEEMVDRVKDPSIRTALSHFLCVRFAGE